jgi:hypothetical protein
MSAQLVMGDGVAVGKVLQEAFLNPANEIFTGAAFFVFAEFDAGFFQVFRSLGMLAQFFGQETDEGRLRQSDDIFRLEGFEKKRDHPRRISHANGLYGRAGFN